MTRLACRFFSTAGLLILSLVGCQALASDFPNRPLKIVVASTPGGPLDFTGRLLAEELRDRLKQPVVVENKPGGGTLIASLAVASAPPDGYTLLLTSSSIVTYSSFVKDSGISILRDLEPIGIVVSMPYVLATTSKREFKTVRDLIEFGKKNPKVLNVATYGNYGVLVTGILNRAAGIEATRVPYQGGAPAHTALVRGDVDYILTDPGSIGPLLSNGSVRLLAVASESRLAEFPNVPTLKEAGKEAGADIPPLSLWFAVFASAKAPAGELSQLQQTLASVMKSPKVIDRLSGFGLTAVSSPIGAFKETLRREQDVADDTAKFLNIKPE